MIYQNLRALFAIMLWPFEPKVHVNKHIRSYYTIRYHKWITVPIGFECDASTGSPNIGISWLFHDRMFKTGKFDDGTPILWRQANRIMLDIMKDEQQPRWVRNAYRRGVGTKYSLAAWREHRSRD